MIVRITGSGKLAMFDACNFTRFSALLDCADQESGSGWHREGDHVWISVNALRRLGPEGNAAWQASFDRMVDFAASRGWFDPGRGDIRAHLERH